MHSIVQAVVICTLMLATAISGDDMRMTKTNFEVYDLSADDFDILCRCVEAEARDCTIEQKMNVASCILARVESDGFPNAVKDVVFQTGQFAVIEDGSYYTCPLTDATIWACGRVCREGKTHDCLFFRSYRSRNAWFETLGEPAFEDGVHRYYMGEKYETEDSKRSTEHNLDARNNLNNRDVAQ